MLAVHVFYIDTDNDLSIPYVASLLCDEDTSSVTLLPANSNSADTDTLIVVDSDFVTDFEFSQV